MSEHYPESAIGGHALAWCPKCGRTTTHAIVRHTEHAGKLGHCCEHKAPMMTKKQLARAAEDEHRRRNPELPFG